MYNTVVDSTPLIKVTSAKHEASYSVNGSLMNPLEAFYAALAACAAVYTKKACKELGISPEGIEVARGLINYGSSDSRRIARHASQDIEEILGYVDEPEIIHRDNLILC